MHTRSKMSSVRASSRNSSSSAAVNDYVCGGGPAQNVWVNSSAVRRALHVPLDSLFFSGDNGEGMTYLPTEKNLMPFYRHVAKTTSLRVLVYNGERLHATKPHATSCSL